MSMISKLAKYGNMKLYCTGYKVQSENVRKYKELNFTCFPKTL